MIFTFSVPLLVLILSTQPATRVPLPVMTYTVLVETLNPAQSQSTCSQSKAIVQWIADIHTWMTQLNAFVARKKPTSIVKTAVFFQAYVAYWLIYLDLDLRMSVWRCHIAANALNVTFAKPMARCLSTISWAVNTCLGIASTIDSTSLLCWPSGAGARHRCLPSSQVCSLYRTGVSLDEAGAC